MFDDSLKLYSNDTLTTPTTVALNVTGSTFDLPQGFPKSGLALVALVQAAATVNRPLTIALQYSIDGTNFLNACETIYATATAKGMRVERWAANLLDLVAGGFDTSKIKVRAKLDSPAHADVPAWLRVYVYLTPVGY
jgi:hypothetical protein